MLKDLQVLELKKINITKNKAMNKASELPYYPRFIFNFNDGNCFSTGDLDEFEYIKEHGNDHEITQFLPGQKIDVSWVNEDEELEIRTYSVNKIEIRQIKYDLDEPTYGINMNDCSAINGRKKKWMMEIYVFLDKIEK